MIAQLCLVIDVKIIDDTIVFTRGLNIAAVFWYNNEERKMSVMKTSLLAISILGLVAGTMGSAEAAGSKKSRYTAKQGKVLQFSVRSKTRPKSGYDENHEYRFEIASYDRQTLRFGNSGFIGQPGYFGYNGYRTQLGNSRSDSLR